MPESTQTLPVQSNGNGLLTTRLLLVVIGLMGAGGIGAGGSTFFRSITPSDVSKQIKTESPYLEDRAIVQQVITRDMPEIRAKLDSMNDKITRQTVILERIEKSNP